jgi:purine-binding chemotaxis protein CheW
MSEDLVVLDLARQHYALPVRQIREVLPRAALTMLPGAPASVLGILSLRGSLLLVVDLRQRLGLPPAPATISQRIAVVDLRSLTIGLLVDAVAGIVDGVGLDDPATTDDAEVLIRQVAEIDGRVVSILDLAAVIGSELVAYVAAVAPVAPATEIGVNGALAIGARKQVRR